MKINKMNVDAFLNTCNECKGEVWLKSIYGDCINLKSVLSQYVAIGALQAEHGDELELFCDLTEDENRFYELFLKNPEILSK